jgi:hypothetical protein
VNAYKREQSYYTADEEQFLAAIDPLFLSTTPAMQVVDGYAAQARRSSRSTATATSAVVISCRL